MLHSRKLPILLAIEGQGCYLFDNILRVMTLCGRPPVEHVLLGVRSLMAGRHNRETRVVRMLGGGTPMLVLSRKPGERILIGDNVAVTIVRIGPNTVRLGIDAPREMNIVREELCVTPPTVNAETGENRQRPTGVPSPR